MDKEKAINIAIGCVMASKIDIETAREVIDVLRELETEDSKLDEIIDYFELREGYDMNEVITDIVHETGLLRDWEDTDNPTDISIDECSINHGEDECYVCDLEEFIDKYTNKLIENVVNVVKSYKEEDK